MAGKKSRRAETQDEAQREQVSEQPIEKLMEDGLRQEEFPAESPGDAKSDNEPDTGKKDSKEARGDFGNTMEHNAYVKNGVSRLVFVGIAVILEVLILIAVFMTSISSVQLQFLTFLLRGLAFLLILKICSEDKTSSIKMFWIMLIMALPIIGTTLFLFIGNSGSTNKMRLRFATLDSKLFPKLPQNARVLGLLKEQNKLLGNLSTYLKSTAGFPVYNNTDVTFYAEASEGIEAQKQDLRRAKKFIFMEYHAIEDAEAFHQIEEILVEKVKEGVEVRLFYDDMGSIGFITTDFISRMYSIGIQCRVFNPFVPWLRLVFNNRDHRKITVIDGEIGYTGGYNIANEYFNLTHPYGYWKDTGLRLEGDAVRSLTVLFLEMWNAVRADDVDDRNTDQYLPEIQYKAKEESFVQPYGDSPLDGEHVGENVYISMVEQAEDYIWLTTPYLILSDEMIHALGLAAKRGVDVRVFTPGIPDKKLIYRITRSYYHSLTKNGVRIYEYTPGFLHAKQWIIDGRAGVCGTINLDFRSLYHHFENACLFTTASALEAMKADFDDLLQKSRDVTDDYRSGRSSFLRLEDLILRIFSPLL